MAGRSQDHELRRSLLLVIALAAVLPTLVAVLTLSRSTDGAIAKLSHELSRVGRESVTESAGRVAGISERRFEETGHALNQMAEEALERSASDLLGASQATIRTAAGRLTQQGGDAQLLLARHLQQLGQKQHQALTDELIAISQAAARDVSKANATEAERALIGTIDRLVHKTEALTGEISEHVIQLNTQAAERLSERMLSEVGREPVVNFRTLALIFAQSLAGGQVKPLQEGYLTVVDRRGRVVASTRHRQGIQVGHLSIVQTALRMDQPDDQLVTFQDEGVPYLGVFARRPVGGAVIFAYLADKARVDTQNMQGEVQKALSEMGSESSGYVADVLAQKLPRIRSEAVLLKSRALADMARSGEAVTLASLRAMRQRAEQVSQRSRETIERQSAQMSQTSWRAMRLQAGQIANRAVRDMQPLAERHAREAVQAMTQQAEAAVADTAQELQGQVKAAGLATAERVPAAAERVAGDARKRSLAIALALLLAEALAIAVASLVLSGRIAAPILTERRLAYEARRRMEQELEIASQIQLSMLPQAPPAMPGVDMAFYFKPADAVGGDYYDLIAINEHQLAIAVGDVNGHGMGAALLMAMAKSAFHTQTGRDPEVGAVMAGLNDMVFAATSERRFMTFLYALIDLERREMVSANAGHHFPYLIGRDDDPPRWLEQKPVYPLGVRHHARYPLCRTPLGAGEGLVFYSDGIIELRNAAGEEFGFERFEQVICRHQQGSAEALKVAVLDAMHSFGGIQDDDITLVVVKLSNGGEHTRL